MKTPHDCITEFIFVRDEEKAADIIMVLGGSHPQLAKKAAEIYRLGLAPFIIFSGGYNKKIPQYNSEADFLAQVADKSGVPIDAILMEREAGHTFDNALLSRQVIKNSGLKIEKALLVCKAYHARRALMTYQTVFPELEFIVLPIIDKREITRDNWFLSQDSIEVVMSEVRKIGTYFPAHILNWGASHDKVYNKKAAPEDCN